MRTALWIAICSGDVLNRCWKPILLASALCLAGVGAMPADASTEVPHLADRSSTKPVKVSAPSSLTEGDRYRVVAKVAHLSKARRITFQQYLPEYGTVGDPIWTDIASRRVKADASH